MIGIKGVGMTMLAQFLAGKGIDVVGSDTKEKYMTDEILESSGIKVIENFSINNIPDDADLIIYSTAYNKNNNKEVKSALKSKIKTLEYAQGLGEIFNQHFGIAVVGSHGKTTTTAWLGYVLDRAGVKPNVLVGANVPQFKGNTLVSASNYLIAEVDEYQNKFKYFSPKGVLLNNIEYDHPDYFITRESYTQVFVDFISRIPASGFLVANLDDKEVQKIANVNCKGKIITYALKESADYVAYDIKFSNGKIYFKVKLGSNLFFDNILENKLEYNESNLLGDFVISLPGKHNIYNALAVIATCIELEVELVDIRTYLEEFTGVARRMQVIGEFNKAIIIDDYAHHPTEIKATLAGVREQYKNKNIITVFHPHTFTRTKVMLDDFANSFGQSDEVIVLDIYGSAREKKGNVSSAELVKKIGRNTKYIPSLKEAEKYLRGKIGKNDIVLLMGAGDVFRIGEKLISKN